MAESVDRLTTIFAIQGLQNQIDGLRKVAQEAERTAKPLNLLYLQSQTLPGGFARFNAGNALAAGGLARIAGAAFIAISALRHVGQVMAEGMRIADEYNQALARAVVLFGNAGRQGSFAALAGFARQRLFATGIAETTTLNLAGQLAERGFSPGRIGQLVPALQDIEAGTGGRVSGQRALEMFLRVLERPQQGGGGSRGLLGLASRLGINIRFTGSIERDLQNLTEAIHQKFGGVAEALASTASGAHLRVQTLLTTALGRLGSLIEAAMLPLFQEMIIQLQGVIVAIDYLLRGGGQQRTNELAAAAGFFGATNPLLGVALYGLAKSREAEANLERQGRGTLQQQMADSLAHIDANTNRMASLVAQTVFGNVSSFTKGAEAYRALNAAIAVRT